MYSTVCRFRTDSPLVGLFPTVKSIFMCVNRIDMSVAQKECPKRSSLRPKRMSWLPCILRIWGELQNEAAMRYSGFRVIKEALTGHKGWTPAWRDPEPKASYDFIIVGGGGHGLATA